MEKPLFCIPHTPVKFQEKVGKNFPALLKPYLESLQSGDYSKMVFKIWESSEVPRKLAFILKIGVIIKLVCGFPNFADGLEVTW